MFMKVFAGAIMGLVALTALPVLLISATAGASQPTPTAAAFSDIPPTYLALYRDATARRCPTLPWSVLAAIGKIESDHGRIGGARVHGDGTVHPRIVGVALDGSPGVARILDTDRGRHDGDTVYDRAVGPMQFIPGTWSAYGLDASGDGVADPHNAIDAIHAAAVYLCVNGADDADQVSEAILAYNRSAVYRDRVLEIASAYGEGSLGTSAASRTLIAMVLANPHLEIYAAGRDDIAAGRVDARVLAVLQMLSEHHTLTISSLKTGHSRCVGGGNYPGCRVSHHWHGRGVDIAAVDGRAISASHVDARALAVSFASLPPELRPAEVGTPWRQLTGFTGFFSDRDHLTHLHLGWAGDR
ncbi:MAG: lytic transglycosylase domain-containing protein [Actinobacteria bacterium]|jgi:hypothetical protein|nr:lytic transglycosylase domain-containing protein [Actinomycetota bacterium]